MDLKDRGLPTFALRLQGLMKACGYKNQADFAQALDTKQSHVSKWLNGKARPVPEAFTRMARLAEGEDKLYFLEQAGIPQAFFDGSLMVSELLDASTSLVARTLSTGNEKLEICTDEKYLTIPLLKNASKMGSKQPRPDNVEHCLSLPVSWFPGDAQVQAIRLAGKYSPFIEGELVALVDVSRRDPDRLLGCVVAVRTTSDVEPMTLRRDGSAYILVPLREDVEHPARILRQDGSWSIVGRVVKWIGDAPQNRK